MDSIKNWKIVSLIKPKAIIENDIAERLIRRAFDTTSGSDVACCGWWNQQENILRKYARVNRVDASTANAAR